LDGVKVVELVYSLPDEESPGQLELPEKKWQKALMWAEENTCCWVGPQKGWIFWLNQCYLQSQ
jgi:hypothetical protein